MKKTKSIFRRLLILVLLLVLYVTVTEPQSTTTASSNEDMKHSQLLNENYDLKHNIKILNKNLKEMEGKINEIKEYNNVIYSQMLGVNFDTINYHKYKNDSAKLIFSENDSIFKLLNERMIYAAEMLALELEKVKKTSSLFKTNKNAIYYYPNISPIKTKDFIKISSPYGMRKHPITGDYIFHEGIDISARPGTPIYSTARGKIVKIMYSKYGYGNRVVIKHAYGFETLYAHLGIIYVKRGQWVRKKQKIGTVGNTGRSTGPHLHYEIHKHNELRDPLGYFYTHITNEYLAKK